MAALLDSDNLPAQARGCAILGAGGGGDPRIGLLMSLHAIGEHGPVRLVDLDELDEDGLVMPCGSIGAPTVSIEKIERGDLLVFETVDGRWAERLERAAAVEFGGAAASTEYCMTVEQARTATVRGSVSLAIR